MDINTVLNDISGKYFRWLCGRFVDLYEHNGKSYYILAKTLHHREFYYSIENDGNREKDGLGLRKVFADEIVTESNGYSDDRAIEAVLSELSYPCSVLEMLVGFAVRLENDVLYDPEKGDHTNKILWVMLRNLGLEQLSDDAYYDLNGTNKVNDILDKWLNRSYKTDGTGGLFPLYFDKSDQRKIELWKQAELYLDENQSF
jgi:hypothetical protein